MVHYGSSIDKHSKSQQRDARPAVDQPSSTVQVCKICDRCNRTYAALYRHCWSCSKELRAFGVPLEGAGQAIEAIVTAEQFDAPLIQVTIAKVLWLIWKAL